MAGEILSQYMNNAPFPANFLTLSVREIFAAIRIRKPFFPLPLIVSNHLCIGDFLITPMAVGKNRKEKCPLKWTWDPSFFTVFLLSYNVELIKILRLSFCKADFPLLSIFFGETIEFLCSR